MKECDEINTCLKEMNMLPTILIATTKSWNIKLANEMKSIFGSEKIHVITQKEEINLQLIDDINPKYIFFPHWSWMIPRDVYTKYCCIVFHMTDLPFGRGGSPLQNLIVRGISETKISALRVVEDVDAGDIFIKHPLSLHGTAEEIYMRAAKIVFQKMMPYILCKNPKPCPQEGVVTSFIRRTPEMSELHGTTSLEKCYDHIRMLDAEGYPQAFIRYGNLCLRFSRATLTCDGIKADVTIEEVVSE